MGVIGCCCKLMAVAVALVAVLIGLALAGAFKPIFQRLDGYEGPRGTYNLGLLPANHEGTPWGFSEAEIPDLAGETHVVTGGNVGLGYWTAFHLAAHNARVVIGCRSEKKCTAAAEKIRAETGTTVETTIVDLSSFASIRACADRLATSHPTIDGLILNAGIMVPPFGLTEDGLERQIGVNHFGHFYLTKLLLPLVEAAAAAKGVATIVPVSSAAHYDSYPEGILPSIEAMNDESRYVRKLAYGQSKLANVLFAQELAERVKAKNVLVNSIHPGVVNTELSRHVIDVVAGVIPGAETYLKSLFGSFVWHPRDAALTQLYAAVGPKLRQQKTTGKYFHPIARESKPDPHTFNQTLQKHLWELTETFLANALVQKTV